MKKLEFTFNAEFKTGADISAITTELKAKIDSSDEPLKSYYKFCLIKLLDIYHEYLLAKFDLDKKEYEDSLKSLKELAHIPDFEFSCQINGVKYSLLKKEEVSYSFDIEVLVSKGLKSLDGKPVKDLTSYVRYLTELDLPVPNFITEDTKTICSFNKKVAKEFEDDELVKKVVKKEIKL